MKVGKCTVHPAIAELNTTSQAVRERAVISQLQLAGMLAQLSGKQAHWFGLFGSHWQVAPVPQSVVPLVHRKVQKCSFGLPIEAQMPAMPLFPQPVMSAQYLPTPRLLPTSPGWPQHRPPSPPPPDMSPPPPDMSPPAMVMSAPPFAMSPLDDRSRLGFIDRSFCPPPSGEGLESPQPPTHRIAIMKSRMGPSEAR